MTQDIVDHRQDTVPYVPEGTSMRAINEVMDLVDILLEDLDRPAPKMDRVNDAGMKNHSIFISHAAGVLRLRGDPDVEPTGPWAIPPGTPRIDMAGRLLEIVRFADAMLQMASEAVMGRIPTLETPRAALEATAASDLDTEGTVRVYSPTPWSAACILGRGMNAVGTLEGGHAARIPRCVEIATSNIGDRPVLNLSPAEWIIRGIDPLERMRILAGMRTT
jgi:hypothetical protein